MLRQCKGGAAPKAGLRAAPRGPARLRVVLAAGAAERGRSAPAAGWQRDPRQPRQQLGLQAAAALRRAAAGARARPSRATLARRGRQRGRQRFRARTAWCSAVVRFGATRRPLLPAREHGRAQRPRRAGSSGATRAGLHGCACRSMSVLRVLERGCASARWHASTSPFQCRFPSLLFHHLISLLLTMQIPLDTLTHAHIVGEV